jgi:hypothetical protein
MVRLRRLVTALAVIGGLNRKPSTSVESRRMINDNRALSLASNLTAEEIITYPLSPAAAWSFSALRNWGGWSEINRQRVSGLVSLWWSRCAGEGHVFGLSFFNRLGPHLGDRLAGRFGAAVPFAARGPELVHHPSAERPEGADDLVAQRLILHGREFSPGYQNTGQHSVLSLPKPWMTASMSCWQRSVFGVG